MKSIVHFVPWETDEIDQRIIYRIIAKLKKDCAEFPEIRRIVLTDDDGLPR